MTNEEAKILNEDFEKFCVDHDIKCAAAYLASAKDKSAVMAYHDIDDNELFHVAASLIIHISQKHNAPYKEVMRVLDEGIADTLKEASTLKN